MGSLKKLGKEKKTYSLISTDFENRNMKMFCTEVVVMVVK